MLSKFFHLLPWIIGGLLLSLPTSTNVAIHTWISSSFASALLVKKEHSSNTNEALSAWASSTEEEYSQARDEVEKALHNKYPFITTKVIFQSTSSWSNTLWINVGSSTKETPFQIRKNCPVLNNDIVVGLIDFVGEGSCRVRLLSDPSLRPSVRVVRGNIRSNNLLSAAVELHSAINENHELMPKEELATALSKLLECFTSSLKAEGEIRLAKGELQGAIRPSCPRIFRGVGFNYEFSDEEGPKRDLRTGQRSLDDTKTYIIKPGDLLETSGLDGIFPKGLRVATVEMVSPLEEGAISYSIVAKTISKEFPNFDYLSIIPAQPVLCPSSLPETIERLIGKEVS